VKRSTTKMRKMVKEEDKRRGRWEGEEAME
jgi:hypothetical protein